MQNIISIDRLLSVWIVLYSYLYLLKMVPYNPILLLFIAYGFTLISSIIIALKSKNITRLIIYFIINTIFKLSLIIMIWKNKINVYDVLFSYILIIIYLVYMNLMKDDIVCVYIDLVKNIIDENNGRKSQIMHYIDYLRR